MEITLSDSTWILSNLGPFEYDLLRRVPLAADPQGCEAAKNRLFPPPIRDPGPDEVEFVAEWEAFVTDEFVTQFSEDLTTFANDMKGAKVTGEDEEGEPLRTLEIPVSHGPQWFSALNQARLVLADVHSIYDESGQISPREDEDFADFHTRWRYYVQSNYYASIQEWLVGNVMPGL